ncbi:MAG: PD-(D/E)XK nuclease family protein [Flavobacteriales bacterium]|nr:PD-(D/E)XK nuclease family protein [Flavobacteriales bacterium]
MSVTTEKIKNLLLSSGRIIAHQEEIKYLKGEHFNVFSILGMESKENETHSAFLGELLNPKGSHLCGTIFLEQFLELINHDAEFDIETASLVLEKHVGTRDDKLKIGGRIDIYLKDNLDNSISIENKIYAGDQFAQIERYVNHNKENNTVYYLTLYGDEATDDSSGELKDGEHYHCISYERTIVQWLNECIKESAGQPILRESIKQYEILIKKLTNQLTDGKMEQEMIDLIRKNYREAKIIESNLHKVELLVARNFLLSLKDVLSNELNDDRWVIEVAENLGKKWEGFTVYHKDWIENVAIKLEGQSIIPYHDIILGIVAHKNKVDRALLKGKLTSLKLDENGYSKESDAWPFYTRVLAWRNEEKRAELFDDEKRSDIENVMFKRILDLAKQCEILLFK